jgi:hypothetical protein
VIWRPCRVAWILPEGHVTPPKALDALDIGVFRLRQHPRTTPFRRSFSAVIAWDWRRAGYGPADHCPESASSSVGDLPAGIKNVPLVVSGPRELAETLSMELGRPVHWLCIGGYGATDPQAVWQMWLADAPSLSIGLATCRDGKCQEFLGTREARMHPSSPAISQMALLMASLALVEPLSAGACGVSGCDAQRVCEASSADLPLAGSWFRSFRVSLRIAARTALNRLARAHRLVGQWSIGIASVPQSATRDLLPEPPPPREFHWIDPGAHRLIADPFLARVGKTKTLFFEELLYSDGKGRLKALPLDAIGRPAGPEVVILEKPYHLSFPFVFEHRNDPDAIFLLPEQAESGDTVLYRSAKATAASLLRFQQDTVLIEGLGGIDPVVLEWNGHFYLFVTNGSFGNVDNNLQLFVSENLRGPYRPHPRNPVKLGLRGSRMAGPLFLHRDALYRPAQDCQSRYGAQVILYRVDVLNPDDYGEAEVAVLSPDAASPYGLASHTVVWYQGLFATDGFREIPISRTGARAEQVKTPAIAAERTVADIEAFLA